MKTRTSLLLSLCLILSLSQAASAKEWTINERQDQLMKDINAGQKKGDLTAKEAKKLRSDLADVARKEAKMRGKTSKGTISDEQKATLEARLNEVSVEIKKLELEKRVDSAKEKAAEKKEAEKAAEKAAEKKTK